MNLRTVVGISLLIRIAASLLNATYFNPDEWWQGPEVAHRLVFGFGATTWEWDADSMLRGYFHPMLLFVWPFFLLKWLGSDSPVIVQWLPRIIQALVATLADVATYLLARRLLFPASSSPVPAPSSPSARPPSPTLQPPPPSSTTRTNNDQETEIVKYTMGLQLSSWFLNYCLVRTYSNSAETAASLLGLALWPSCSPKRSKQPVLTCASNYAVPLALASISVLLRPTAAIFWLPVVLYEMYMLALHAIQQSSRSWALYRALGLLLTSFAVALTALVVGCLIDRLGYGQWTLVPLNFVKFNVVQNLAGFYGTHSWHWYLSNGLPTMLFTASPLALAGLYCLYRDTRLSPSESKPRSRSKDRRLPVSLLVWIVVFVVAVYSLLGHKEFRFVLPVLPLLFIFGGYAAAHLRQYLTESKKTSWFAVLMTVVLLSNVAMFAYFGVGHQRGVMDLMQRIRDDRSIQSVHFLMPCHSTPLYTHIHRPIDTRYLQCLPPVPGRPHYDEADDFFDRPLAFLREQYTTPEHLPSHFALFSPVLEQIQPFLLEHGYQLTHRFWHTYTPVDSRHGDVLLFSKA